EGSIKGKYEEKEGEASDDGRELEFFIMTASCKLSANNGKVRAEISPSKPGCYVAVDGKGRGLFEGTYIGLDLVSVNNPQEIGIKEFLNGIEEELELKVIRFAAGGAIPILKLGDGKNYVVLIRRDENAPVHPQHFTTASGLSETFDELMDPRLIIGREFLKEIAIFACSDEKITKHYNVRLGAEEKEDGYKDIYIKYFNRYYTGLQSNLPENEEDRHPYYDKYQKLKEKFKE
ncbi:MAG: hypothetical protein ACP5UZ_08620, partial [Thermoplasmata archaeon]